MNFQFCLLCGKPPISKKMRPTCDTCHWTHYRNPTVGVAFIVVDAEAFTRVF